MRAQDAWAFALDAIGAAVSVERCAGCDARIAIGVIFCSPCAASLVDAEQCADGCVAVFRYGGAIAEAIARFKYQRRPELARPLGAVLCRGLGQVRRPDVVAPVPLAPARLVERGYNQAALLAARLAHAAGWRCAPRALARTRDTVHQAHLSRELRPDNVRGAFAARRRCSGLRVLLVDDVVTTGATLEQCKLALMSAGATAVDALVLARAS